MLTEVTYGIATMIYDEGGPRQLNVGRGYWMGRYEGQAERYRTESFREHRDNLTKGGKCLHLGAGMCHITRLAQEISREVVVVEKSQDVIALNWFGVDHRKVRFVHDDAMHFLPTCQETFDDIFIDHGEHFGVADTPAFQGLEYDLLCDWCEALLNPGGHYTIWQPIGGWPQTV